MLQIQLRQSCKGKTEINSFVTAIMARQSCNSFVSVRGNLYRATQYSEIKRKGNTESGINSKIESDIDSHIQSSTDSEIQSSKSSTDSEIQRATMILNGLESNEIARGTDWMCGIYGDAMMYKIYKVFRFTDEKGGGDRKRRGNGMD